MDKIKIAKVFGAISVLTGLAVMIGWFYDISVLKSILPNWVAMKVLTAVSFILSGTILYVMAKYSEGEVTITQVVLPGTSIAIFLIMATLLTSALIGVRLGIEDLIVKETKLALRDTAPGMPSIGTMIAFVLISIAGMMTALNAGGLKSRIMAVGWMVGILGGLAIIGYIVDVPLLTYYIKGASTAMAFHTAILFVILGTGLVIVGSALQKAVVALRFSVGTKIGAGIAFAISLLLIIGAISQLASTKFGDAAVLWKHSREVKDSLNQVSDFLKDAEFGERNYVLTGDEHYLEQYHKSIGALEPEVRKLRSLIEDNPAQRKRLDMLEPLLVQRVAHMREGIELFGKKGRESTLRFITSGKGQELMRKILAVHSEIDREEDLVWDNREKVVRDASGIMGSTILYGIPFSFIALILAGFIIINNISEPLREMKVTAERIAEGDLTSIITFSGRRDEVGALTQAFARMTHYLKEMASTAEQIASNDLSVKVMPLSDKDILGNAFAGMVENLRKINTEIRDVTNVLASSVSEILATTTQVASGMTETATAVSETTATVEEVRQTALLSSEKSRGVSENAQKAAQVAQQGNAAVSATMDGINHIRGLMETVAEGLVKLSEQTQSIGDIISAVNDLAQQSNLLAVNAAIEAAKAGEQGKGFTVVAQEIKSLADQSKQSTEQVRTILSEIQKATCAAVMAAEQVSKAVETGVKQGGESGVSITNLAKSVAEAAQAAIQISASTQQQLVGMEQIVQAMENIKQSTQQNVAGTKQAEQAAHNLNELGQKLKEVMGRYKV